MAETALNTIFEQDGRVYAICATHVRPKDLAKFVREELIYGTKHIPRFQMSVVTTEEFRKMPFGKPETRQEPEPSTPTGKKVQNILELKGLLIKHKIGTQEAKEILSISEVAQIGF